MKKVIFLFAALVVAFSVQVKAQQAFTVTYYDTLSSADTLSYVVDWNVLKKADFYISSHLQADSVSGATGATAWLQVSNQESGNYWYNLDTVTINGVQTKDWHEDILYAVRLRLYVISAGTQVTTVRWGLHATPR